MIEANNLMLIGKPTPVSKTKQDKYWIVYREGSGSYALTIKWVVAEYKRAYPKRWDYYKTYRQACDKNGLDVPSAAKEKFFKNREYKNTDYFIFKTLYAKGIKKPILRPRDRKNENEIFNLPMNGW